MLDKGGREKEMGQKQEEQAHTLMQEGGVLGV